MHINKNNVNNNSENDDDIINNDNNNNNSNNHNNDNYNDKDNNNSDYIYLDCLVDSVSTGNYSSPKFASCFVIPRLKERKYSDSTMKAYD